MNTLSLVPVLLLAVVVGCASIPSGDERDEGEGTTGSALSSGSTFTAKATGYYPSSSALEGGFVDRKGNKLRTLQQYLAGSADYVSVAMDANAFSYGQHLRIRELDAKYGRAIDFRVVDTGGAFKGKGRTRIDVCTANARAAGDDSVNGKLTITTAASAPTVGAVDPGATTAPAPSPTQTPPTPAQTTPRDPDADAIACGTSDGVCNPGNNGSGMICVDGSCVPGCHANIQCPGNTMCVDGQCE